MGLNPIRQIGGTTLDYPAIDTFERGGVVSMESVSGITAARYLANPSGAVPLGFALNDVEWMDLSRHKHPRHSGREVTEPYETLGILTDGVVETDWTYIIGTVRNGDPAYVGPSGTVTNVSSLSIQQIGYFVSDLDAVPGHTVIYAGGGFSRQYVVTDPTEGYAPKSLTWDNNPADVVRVNSNGWVKVRVFSRMMTTPLVVAPTPVTTWAVNYIGAYTQGSIEASGLFGAYIEGGSLLSTSLNAFWKLEEASGERQDALGVQHLTDNNTVTSTTGKVGDAAQFTSATFEYLNRTSNSVLQTNGNSFSVAGWVYVDTDVTMAFCSKWNTGGGGEREFLCRYDSSHKIEFFVSSNGVNNFTIVSNETVDPGSWYFVYMFVDTDAQLMGISVNNGTLKTQAHTAGVHSDDADFLLSSFSNGASSHFDGRIDAFGYWSRALTSSEVTELYNSGDGIEHPFT